jgi:hypothetical protein
MYGFTAEEVTIEIQINIDIYSPAEMQKPFKKRLPAKSGFMIISSFTSFSSFLREITQKISKITKLPSLVNKDGMVLQFIVPHWVLNPLDLDDQEMYKHMLAKSQKSKDPVANVIVELEVIFLLTYVHSLPNHCRMVWRNLTQISG